VKIGRSVRAGENEANLEIDENSLKRAILLTTEKGKRHRASRRRDGESLARGKKLSSLGGGGDVLSLID